MKGKTITENKVSLAQWNLNGRTKSLGFLLREVKQSGIS